MFKEQEKHNTFIALQLQPYVHAFIGCIFIWGCYQYKKPQMKTNISLWTLKCSPHEFMKVVPFQSPLMICSCWPEPHTSVHLSVSENKEVENIEQPGHLHKIPTSDKRHCYKKSVRCTASVRKKQYGFHMPVVRRIVEPVCHWWEPELPLAWRRSEVSISTATMPHTSWKNLPNSRVCSTHKLRTILHSSMYLSAVMALGLSMES